MQEILPGVFHWEATHPHIHAKVSSYWLEEGGVAIDPLLPEAEGIEWFAARTSPPSAVLLSNRHHYRHAGRLQEAFGCTIHCNSQGLHEFTHGEQVTPFEPGDELPGGVRAERVGGICPDDSALYVPAHGAICFADAVVRGDLRSSTGELGFVPDSLMDDPPHTKRAILDAITQLLERLDFDTVLLAHGAPLVGDGRAQLQGLVDCGGRTAFEM